MVPSRLLLAALAATTLGGLVAPVLALAQPGARAADHVGAQGPRVVRPDPDTSRFSGPPVSVEGEDLVAIGAVPVPSVMNGPAFGPNGNDYFDDMRYRVPGGRPRRGSDDYVLAPGYRSQPLR